MRNLKKVLAMALALVMSLSLVTIANAADFSDDADISYKEAVDVMSAIGVINGYEDGSFQPEGVLTREEAAKLICTMLLGDSADRLGTTSSSFTDVAATRWSSPFIEYCNSLGIIAGNGDGTFDPNGELTGYAFAKMLLVALGYDSAREGYTGAGWSIEVAKDAITAGITVDGVSLNDEVTREVAAQMCLNTLEATLVEYATAGTTVTTPDGTTVVTAGSTASKVENSDTKAGYDGEKDGYQQFCEEYFSDLKKSTSSVDNFGRPADKWTYKRTNVGTYADEADASYTEEVNSKTLYADLDLDETTKASVMTDGKDESTFTIQKGNTTKIGGNGVLVEAFVDDDDNVSIVVINTYVGEVSKVTPAKDGDEAYVTVDGLKYETENFEKDDVVIYTLADGEIQSMSLAEKVEGVEVSRVNGTSSFVADGDTYKFNGNVKFSSDVKVDSVLDLYVDANGYVMKVDVSKASSDYAYVIDTGYDKGLYSDDDAYYAKLLLSDGTQVEVEVDEDCLTGSDKEAALSGLKGYIVEYTKDSKNVYTLNAMGTKLNTSGKAVEIDNGKSAMTLGKSTYYANSKTIFLVQSGTGSKATYTAYVGYANVPDMKSDSGHFAVYAKSGTVATVVFVSGVSTSSDDIVYVLASKKGTEVKDTEAGTYWEYKAVVNGEITTVKMNKSIDGSDVLYSSISYADRENEILDASACEKFSTTATDDSYALSGKVTAEPDDDIIGIDSKSYAISSDVEYYAVTSGDKIESGSEADLEKDVNVTAIVKNGEVVTIFYGVKASSSSGEGGSSEVAVDDRYSAIYTEAGITSSIRDNNISISVDRTTLKEFIANEANAGDLAQMEGVQERGHLWVGVTFEAPEGATKATFSGDVTGDDNVDSEGMIYLWLSVADKDGSGSWTVQSADKSYEITLTWKNASDETVGAEKYSISIDF